MTAVLAVAVHIPKHRHVVTVHGAVLPAVVPPAVEAVISGQRKQIERIRFPRHIEVGPGIIPTALISGMGPHQMVGASGQVFLLTIAGAPARPDLAVVIVDRSIEHNLVGLEPRVDVTSGLPGVHPARQLRHETAQILLPVRDDIQDSSHAFGLVLGSRLGNNLYLFDRGRRYGFKHGLKVAFQHRVLAVVHKDLEAGLPVYLYVVLGINRNTRHFAQDFQYVGAARLRVLGHVVG